MEKKTLKLAVGLDKSSKSINHFDLLFMAEVVCPKCRTKKNEASDILVIELACVARRTLEWNKNRQHKSSSEIHMHTGRIDAGHELDMHFTCRCRREERVVL